MRQVCRVNNWRLCEQDAEMSYVRTPSPLVRDYAHVDLRSLYPDRIVGVMATEVERNWTAHLVISCEHAGLRPHFKALETELFRVLARVDDPREVMRYLRQLCLSSEMWMSIHQARKVEK
jgi:hypothetical protein